MVQFFSIDKENLEIYNQEFITKIQSICSYFKGRTTFVEMMNMPLSYINFLYKLALDEWKTEQGRKNKEAEMMESELEDMV